MNHESTPVVVVVLLLVVLYGHTLSNCDAVVKPIILPVVDLAVQGALRQISYSIA